MYFGLLNPNFIWKKRFDRRISEITSKKLLKSRVSVGKLEKKKEHCFRHIKNTLFYVYWLAESKFLMEKEVWQPCFGDNLNELSKSRVSVEKLEKKKKHCFHYIKNTLFLCILACWIQISYGKRGLTAEFPR